MRSAAPPDPPLQDPSSVRRSWHLFRHRSWKNYTFARVELFFQTDVEVVVGGGKGGVT